jgi:hypothetical protein
MSRTIGERICRDDAIAGEPHEGFGMNSEKVCCIRSIHVWFEVQWEMHILTTKTSRANRLDWLTRNV